MQGIEQLIERVAMPEVAREALREQGRTMVPLGDGISLFAGHSNGVAYRFFTHIEKQEAASKIAGYSINKSIEMIEWLRDKGHKPTERVRLLPSELLHFDPDGEVVSGEYAEAYRRWKQGLNAPGTSLAKWGELSDEQIATFADMGIFSVEQLADYPRAKITQRLPQDFEEALDKAIDWMARKDVRALNDKQSEIIANLTEKIAQLERLVGQTNTEKTEDAPVVRRGRPAKKDGTDEN